MKNKLAFVGWASALVVVLLAAFAVFYPGDQTIYADGYSDQAFAKVKPGMSRLEVEDILSSPVSIESRPHTECMIYWVTSSRKISCDSKGAHEILEIRFDDRNRVERISGEGEDVAPRLGTRKSAVIERLGEPCDRRTAVVLWYSRPGENGLFRARGVAFDLDGLVEEVIDYEWWD